ncbi:hypothetical protein BDW42DRAFT_182204 [Aspergillus taichungensis]|uniref:Uncharacterized protein n=1 Tax=Aspergillus taichungensis TaxID=482145 RepID=A0A2J5HC24_9EURO|nr:hypothetical protein BDW42DRAFT_182204 [Aspergillus taichungensis]
MRRRRRSATAAATSATSATFDGAIRAVRVRQQRFRYKVGRITTKQKRLTVRLAPSPPRGPVARCKRRNHPYWRRHSPARPARCHPQRDRLGHTPPSSSDGVSSGRPRRRCRWCGWERLRSPPHRPRRSPGPSPCSSLHRHSRRPRDRPVRVGPAAPGRRRRRPRGPGAPCGRPTEGARRQSRTAPPPDGQSSRCGCLTPSAAGYGGRYSDGAARRTRPSRHCRRPRTGRWR